MENYFAHVNPWGELDFINIVRTIGEICGECHAKPTDCLNYRVTTGKTIPDYYIEAFGKLGVKISKIEEKVDSIFSR